VFLIKKKQQQQVSILSQKKKERKRKVSPHSFNVRPDKRGDKKI